MYIVNSYTLAIIFCFITMICWGSWGNTQKLASKNWRYELYYWDYTIGILLFALLLVFTLGSFGDSGRGFLEDIQQVEAAYIASALIGGAIFNASNILLSASYKRQNKLFPFLKTFCARFCFINTKQNVHFALSDNMFF